MRSAASQANQVQLIGGEACLTHPLACHWLRPSRFTDFHVLALDGVDVRSEGALVFRALPAPTRADVTEVARRTAVRTEPVLSSRRPKPREPRGATKQFERLFEFAAGRAFVGRRVTA